MKRFNICVLVLLANSIWLSQKSIATAFVQADDLATEVALVPESSEEEKAQLVLFEAQRFASSRDLTEQQTEELKDKVLTDDFKTRLEEIGCAGDFHSNEKLKMATWDQMEQCIDKAHQPAFKEYRLESVQVYEFCNETIVDGVVFAMDSRLALTEQQEDSIKKVLLKNWDAVNNEEAFYSMAFGAYVHSLIHVKDQVAKFLRPSQLELAFDEEVDERFDRFSMMDSESIDDALEIHKETCRTCMNLKIEEINLLCELNEKQLRQLSVAAKGAIVKATDVWYSTIKRKGDMLVEDLEGTKLLATSPIYQCTSQELWKKTLNRVLNADQIELLNRREEARNEQTKRCGIGYSLFSNRYQEVLGPAEFNALKSVYLKTLTQTEIATGDTIEAIVQCMLVPEEELEPALSNRNWEQLQRDFSDRRNEIEEMQTSKEDLSEDTADDAFEKPQPPAP